MTEVADARTPDQMREEIARLEKVVKALMNRAERAMSTQASDFGLFQTTIMLEDRVRKRTQELEAALRDNERINRDLQRATMQKEREIEERARIQEALEAEKEEQKLLIKRLEEAHCQLLQSEKLASIGQLAAGVAHEINNPIGFVNSNLGTLKNYVADMLRLIDAYEEATPTLAADVALSGRIEGLRQEIDLEFLREDVVTLIAESIDGTSRVRQIVQDLRDFSRTGEVEWEWADIHTGIESTLNVVRNEIKYKAELVKEFGDLPRVECLPSQLNQVFMNLLVNAAQAIRDHGTITVRSGRADDKVWISIADTGSGIAPENLAKIFDPFFTTKPVGKGTGLGLSLSYGIVERHGGQLEVRSTLGEGTTFTIWLPVCQKHVDASVTVTA